MDADVRLTGWPARLLAISAAALALAALIASMTYALRPAPATIPVVFTQGTDSELPRHDGGRRIACSELNVACSGGDSKACGAYLGAGCTASLTSE